MKLYHVRGQWRRAKPYQRTLALDELVVAESDAHACELALAAWRAVWPTLDGEPVCSSVRAAERVGEYAVRLEVPG